ncbi:hypothetical protein [Parashewanella tropica]|uniref:hypothetical protein n=1 Tax=Parashewanella tropica TaxID=2547970 RepID=UPI00105A9E0F|nr:hypothetical protein [Parashewanella tropica]
MSEINQVLQFAKRLHTSGKKPTTALLKAKLGKTIPMPLILKGLQQFNSLSEQEIRELVNDESTVVKAKTELSLSLEEQVKVLQQQVGQLQSQQSLLLNRIEQLEKQ